MIVWLFSPFSPLPGPGTHKNRSAVLAEGLINAGHEVVWFSMDWDHRKKKRTSSAELPTYIRLIHAPAYSKNISLRRFYSHWVWGRRLFQTSKQWVEKEEISPPDLILASSPPLDAVTAAYRLQKHWGCRVKIDLTDLWPHTFCRITAQFSKGISQFLFFPLFRMAYSQWKRADGVSAMSQEYLEEVLRITPQQNTHLCYIGGNISPAQISTKQPPVSFIYLGALTDSYDFDTLWSALQLLQNSEISFHLHIAGSGPLETRLLNSVKSSNLLHHVTFHGYLLSDELNDLMAKSQVGLNIIRPGLHITMPHKLCDYLCHGVAVINSLQGEAADLLDYNQAGLTYQPDDPASLADCMRIMIEQPLKLQNMQKASHRLAKREMDRNKTYPKWANWIVDN
ncbi:glycosyltransferase family 4 protein [Kiritimatiellaeota bacterium B1221]|nr:glycosyltransferase family 4 protein [Kiritimatiellaeota bacterium B1221]